MNIKKTQARYQRDKILEMLKNEGPTRTVARC